MMPKSEFVEYRGERFYLQSSKRYFQSGRKGVEERLLHRRVWADANGAIPPGMTIHHKDGDWRNNDLSNLELLHRGEHFREHMLERWADEASRSEFERGLEKAREAAKAWHSSDEGLAWHKQNGKRSWSKKRPVEIACAVCEERFLGHPSAGAKVCSKACGLKLTYPNRFTVDRVCVACGVSFKGSRYRETRYCSRACSNRHRHAA